MQVVPGLPSELGLCLVGVGVGVGVEESPASNRLLCSSNDVGAQRWRRTRPRWLLEGFNLAAHFTPGGFFFLLSPKTLRPAGPTYFAAQTGAGTVAAVASTYAVLVCWLKQIGTQGTCAA